MDVDRIAEVFKDQVLFITGATGFMGKVFLERLLRVTEVRKIFILIRPKRNKNSEERLIELFANPLFDQLKSIKSMSEILEKVIVIAGDCSYKDLNISPADRAAIVSQVSMIYHFAATVKFNEKFKCAIELNVRGTREMVKIAFDCSKLKVFCHLSTAFCHLKEKFLLNQFYEVSADPHEIIDIVEKFDEDEVGKMLSEYLCDTIPNTYVFTKGLSEAIIAKAQEKYKLPMMIARPAIILPIYKDPLPGWTDNLYNITGALAAGGLGVCRSFLCDKDDVVNITCVDYATGNVMTSVWHYLQEKPKSLYVINLEYLKCSLIDDFQKAIKARQEIPSDFVFWYPNVHFTDNVFIHFFNLIFFQWLPSLFIDFILILLGKKPMFINIQKKMFNELKIVKIFIKDNWTFDQTKIVEIYKLLNKRELESYGTESRNSEQYHRNISLGLRRFILKQKDENIGRAQMTLKIIFIIDRLVKGAFFYWIIKKLWSIFW
ncbi:hypothetical protein PVAND_016764 [Polypedilum vanderplanki]|uniref:Fatty acyl-CoA reductase n=1 Tax=Polypedilum vanderplanki TaxID=319348 RepID=A0A9J6BGL3_POLVA|nr:hypothetical protein PVAND_016764 [Polypedilum vanderplanki]